MSDGKELAHKANLGVSGSIVAGRKQNSSDDDMGVTRLVMFTGTDEDIQRYGEGHKRGEFIDDLTGDSFGMKVRICVVGSWATYARFEKGQRAPVYSYKSWGDVPEQHRNDFEWSGPKENRKPPVGTESVNAIIVVLDDQNNPIAPYLFRFKRTSLPVWDDNRRGIEVYERRFGACVYELGSKRAENAAKQGYAKLTGRLVQKLDPGTPLRENLEAFRAQFAALRSKAEEIEETSGGGDGGEGDLPF